MYSLCDLSVKSLFLPYPLLQHSQHPKSSIEHIVMLKDHLIESVQRETPRWICMLQCSHGHVQTVGLVAQRGLRGCDHFKCLLNNKNNNISTLDGASSLCIFTVKTNIFGDLLNLNKIIVVITCLCHFLWCLS